MNKTFKYLAGGLMALFATACSDNTPEGLTPPAENTPEAGDAVYMSVDIELPNSRYSRSATNPDGSDDISDAGVEVGTDSENHVERVLVVLTDRNNNYISYAYVNNASSVQGTGADRTVVTSFNKSALLNYYEHHATGSADERRKVNIYVVCNFPNWGIPGEGKNLIEILNDEVPGQPAKFLDRRYELVKKVADGVEFAYVWRDNNFMMTNSAMCSSHLPSLDDLNMGKHNSKSDPFSLTSNGPVTVERSVARLDYKAGGTRMTLNGRDSYYYPLQKNNSGDDILFGEITALGMVNLSNNFYYFRRVANAVEGVETVADYKNTILLGREHNKNYVIDTDAEFKAGDLSRIDFGNYFFYPLVKEYDSDGVGLLYPSTWYRQNVSEILASDSDNYGNREYHRWRYVSENTIPKVSAQKNGISTGIIFKVKVHATPGMAATMPGAYAALSRSWNVSDYSTAPALYIFGNKFYGTREDLLKYFHTFESEKSRAELLELPVFQAFMGSIEGDVNGNWVDFAHRFDQPDSNGEYTATKPIDLGFMRLRCRNHTDVPAYYMYYYYWNRHNDNGNNNQMGIMEFATVRNNVYKICVTSIDGFGHPIPGDNGDQNDDPNPINPNHPDEKADIYVSVSVKIMPWVVRINDVAFP